MAWHHELAEEFKKRNNEFKIGPVTGEVVESNGNQYKIFILDRKLLIDNSNSHKAYGLTMNVGDNVLILSSDSNDTFYIVCRLE